MLPYAIVAQQTASNEEWKDEASGCTALRQCDATLESNLLRFMASWEVVGDLVDDGQVGKVVGEQSETGTVVPGPVVPGTGTGDVLYLESIGGWQHNWSCARCDAYIDA